MAERTTYIEPGYKLTISGHREIDGISFKSYRIGVNQYAFISADGKIFIRRQRTSYHARIIGHGWIMKTAPNGKERFKAFRHQATAIDAAIKIWRAKHGRTSIT